MTRSLLARIRALRTAAGPVERWHSPRRIYIPDIDRRLRYSPDELAALEAQVQAQRDAAAAAGFVGRIFVPPLQD
jgi:hypothetical protein